jgi:lysophospholipase L1-like esterase
MFEESPRRYYVSLGDSISIDAYAGGSGRGAASLLYQNRDNDFPGWQGKDLKTCLPGIRLIPLAMDGATSATLRYVQLPQLQEMRIHPEIITVTIGGNDLLQSFGMDYRIQNTFQALQENLHASLTLLRNMAGAETPILLGTIYDPSDGTGNAGELQLSHWRDALTWVARFNTMLQEIAYEHQCTVADIHGHFMGHGAVAGDPSQAESHPENRDLWYCGTIEPNAWGASAVRAVLWDCLRTQGVL